MQLPQPDLRTSERMVGLVDRPQMVPSEGPIADAIFGYHTLWIAEVPFIPTYVSPDQKEFDTTAASRLTHVLQRQVRFLYDLAQSREHLSTFELRLVSWPQANGPSQVGIAFLGKTFHEDRQVSQQLALELWNKFSAIFPREAPFSYPLVPVLDLDVASNGQTHSFSQWYAPIPFERLTRPANIVELRKYEDWPTIRDIGGVLHARDYIPHPFVAALDYSAMARLFETLARQPRLCIVAITLRPQRLTDQEVVILHELVGWYQRVARGEATLNNPLVDVLRELKSDVFDSYFSTRAELGRNVYENFVREHRSLFTVRLQVIGDPITENDLVEALGSEVMANAGSAYPSRWTRVEAATPKELHWARFNLQWLEFARWGISPLIRQSPSLIRLRQLATVSEAAGAFRLPVASGNSGVAGIEVRDEPFALPPATGGVGQNARLTIGRILDRGIPTEMSFSLAVDALAGIGRIFGDAGPAREGVLQELLKGISQQGIPWVLIRGTSRDTLAHELHAQCVSIDALSQASPLRIHPFLPPPDVPLRTFLDALLRVFTVVHNLEPAAAIVLRRVLIETYERAGWTGQASDYMADMADLPTKLGAALQQTDAPADCITAIRTQCILPLQDLAATAGHVFPTSSMQDSSWNTPTLLEIGWLGSDTSSALVRGCLWAWFALAFSSTPISSRMLRGVVGLEEAHTIFGPQPGVTSTSSVPTSALAQTLARAGVGTLLLDDRPDLLDGGITSGLGITLLTRNVNEVALEKAAKLIGVSQREQMRIRRLSIKEAVAVVPGTTPVLIML